MKEKATAQNATRTASALARITPATLAETFWFVSSFVMSVALGPFSALPALVALFSLDCQSPLPMSAAK
ncbi:hypothetical protein ACUUL3_15675 [Thiovibrio sp. JS02]